MNYKSAIIIKNISLSCFSGIMMGISSGFVYEMHLEFLAWFGFVPLLLVLKNQTKFTYHFLYTYISFSVFLLISIYSFFDAFLFGGSIVLLIGSLQFAGPVLIMYFFQKRFGWKKSLIFLPLVWTAWEYFILQSKLSVAILSISVTQAPYTWLIQHIDIFGSGIITFWLVLINIIFVLMIDDWSINKLKKRWLIYSAILIVIFITPLLYSAYIFNSSKYTAGEEITLSLVQPNVDPQKKWGNADKAAALLKTINLTDSLIQKSKPDLIIWPEAAVPYIILHEDNIRNEVFDAVKKWNTSLLTGTVDIKYYGDPRTIPQLLKYLNRDYEIYNCALMITPQLAAIGKEPGFKSLNIKTYKKRNLMPFTESVPYADIYPVLSNLALDFGGGANWSQGAGPKTLLFADMNKKRVKVSPAICWDILYPETILESANNGAEFLAFISNEGWFGKTITAHEIEGFTRLRSIETRRSIAKCGNTGYTFFTDLYGSVYGKIDWWEENYSTEKVRLSNVQTLYMLYPGYFPMVCLLLFPLIFIWLSKKRIH